MVSLAFTSFGAARAVVVNVSNMKNIKTEILVSGRCFISLIYVEPILKYIFTSIEDDIPAEILNTFTPNEICLSLDDSGDKGKLFEFSF